MSEDKYKFSDPVIKKMQAASDELQKKIQDRKKNFYDNCYKKIKKTDIKK